MHSNATCNPHHATCIMQPVGRWEEGFKEGQTNEIQLPTITGKLLEKAGDVEYDWIVIKSPSSLVTCDFNCDFVSSLSFEVIEYLYFKYKYTDAKVCSECSDWIMQNVYHYTCQVPIPEFPIDDDVVLATWLAQQ